MRFGVYGVVATANLIIWWSVRSIRGGPPPIFPYIWLCECLTGVTSATARIGALLLIGGLHWCAWPLESENELPAIYGARGTRSEKKKTARTSKSTILGGRISLKFASKIVESSCLLLTPCLGSMLRLGHLLKWLVRFTSNIHTEGIWLWTRPEAYLRCACWSCILQGPRYPLSSL